MFLSIAIIQNLTIFDNSTTMSPNVSVVTDGLPARIRACEARPGLVNCGWRQAWEPSGDLASRNPSRLSGVLLPSCYAKWLLFGNFFV
jgi:hypothetical protein